MKRTVKSSKSRGGCQRCKSKHIKCDETKPSCQICVAQGAECPGYAKQLRWSNKHEVFPPPLTGPPPQKRQRTTSQDVSVSPPDELRGSAGPSQVPVSNGNGNGDAVYSDPGVPGEFTGLSDEGALDMYGWPDMEHYGLEDLTFSTLFPGPSPEGGHAAPFSQPFLGGLYGGLSHLIGDTSDDSNGSASVPLEQESTQDTDPAKQQVATTSDQASSSRQASFLKTFYRLAVPNKVPGFSDDDLVSHYFNHVCAIYSCFDSDTNQFRTLVAEHCATSSTIRYTIESMAIGHLANFYPHIAALGNAKRGRAWKSLQQDLQLLRTQKTLLDTVLLNLLLLGLSSSWHQASNLGLQYLYIARDLAQVKLQRNEHSPHDEFFFDAIMFWEMLASFIDPVPMADLQGLKSPDLTLPVRPAPIRPHPWTGVSSEISFVLAEVGRMLRRRVRNGSLGSGDEEWAMHLERLLHDSSTPPPSDIVDPGDKRTPVSDLLLIAKAYRLIGLLEIYRAFPKLFWERVSQAGPEFAPQPEQKEYKDELDARLTELACRILDLLKAIPIVSGACRLMPLIMLVSGSQLRMPDGEVSNPTRYDEIVEMRYMVEQRMLVLSRKYAQRPQLCALDIVKEVWERADAHAAGAHWIDVAHDKNWQTLFG
ncbi:Putative zn(2)-C6 fungal-type DNA-binding domain, fungal transcription factor [Septoria linicola]|uniref:Zn(2)-C6 fungal-type DNA-binding domain, fungal transcription factor n=1 Tax=Septoria linicola TaxID=215465 RepID=A0A9Q9EG28_9PEZI|nr:putative zn(2)-C6 fungal-type DNA-binding domain, fungal transcription factor [Septoria linicola]USW50401.1 Putative zn(2)-C6 fungal-type DNA-binding domain, fungal transcription factor [Septoria linicola]